VSAKSWHGRGSSRIKREEEPQRIIIRLKAGLPNNMISLGKLYGITGGWSRKTLVEKIPSNEVNGDTDAKVVKLY
jgi:hypothetical protein